MSKELKCSFIYIVTFVTIGVPWKLPSFFPLVKSIVCFKAIEIISLFSASAVNVQLVS